MPAETTEDYRELVQALQADVEALECRVDRHHSRIQAAAVAVLLLDVGLYLAFKDLRALENATSPTPTSPWVLQRLDALETRLHMHIRPEEYTHHEP